MPPSELLRCEGLPRFDAIEAEHVDQQIPALLADLSERFTTLEDQLRERLSEPDSTPLSWDELMPPFHALGERLRWSWGVVTHLTAVRNTPELREAHARQQPEVVRYEHHHILSMHQALIELELCFLLIVLILQLSMPSHLDLTSLGVLLVIFDQYQRVKISFQLLDQ